MKEKLESRKNKAKDLKRDLLILGIVLVITFILLSIFPDKRVPVFKASKNFFVEMISILPAVMILMALFNVFVPKELVVKYLGKSAGIKAIFLGILIGALPTGPLYVAFPIASSLLKKGAKVSCIIAFLSAWACIKIPQEMVELQFLGFKFMLARLTLTVFFVIIMGVFIEWIVEKEKEMKNQD